MDERGRRGAAPGRTGTGHTEDAPTEMPRDREIPEGREEVRARADSRLYGGKAAEQGADGVIRLFAG